MEEPNKSRCDELEDKEINEILSKIYAENLKSKKDKSSNFTSIKNLDWMNDLFLSKDIKNIYLQNSHVKEILIDQGLYYLYIFYLIFIEWNKEREIEKLTREERQRQKKEYSSLNLPPIDMKQILKKVNIPILKVGIIGCGNIGSLLLKKLIQIKDNKILSFKILVSTRRPNNIGNDIKNSLDEDIKIFLDNEKIFEECDIIFLCVQPHNLDLLSKEIFQSFNEKIEKLQKKEYKLYPLIISFLSSIPIERLKMFFPKKINIIRTNLMAKNLKARKKDFFGDGSSNVEEEYAKEACDHLIEKDKFLEKLSYIFSCFINTFYLKVFQDKNKNKGKKKEILFKDKPDLVFDSILGKSTGDKYKDFFDSNSQVFSFVESPKKNFTDSNSNEDKKEDEKNLNTEPNKISRLDINEKTLINDFKVNFMNCLKKLIVKKNKFIQ